MCLDDFSVMLKSFGPTRLMHFFVIAPTSDCIKFITFTGGNCAGCFDPDLIAVDFFDFCLVEERLSYFELCRLINFERLGSI